MSDKKFYYLQLESSLFSDMKMMMLDRQNNKKDLLYFLIQLSVISIKNEGKIMLDDEPANIETLSLLTGEFEEDVEKWIKTLTKLKLISFTDNTYIVDFASERIGSITDRAIRKQKEKARNLGGTVKELEGTKAELKGKSSAEVPQCKSKSYNKSKKLDIELEKDIELDIELKEDKKKNKEKNALLEKDAESVYEFYRINIKGGSKKVTVINLKKFLKDYTKDELIKSIDNYIFENKKNNTDIKYYKKPENFFSKASEVFAGYTGFDALREDKVKEFFVRMESIRDNVFASNEGKARSLEDARDTYIDFLTDVEIEKGRKIIMGEPK